jgi:Gamma-glutamyl cyclotransferase, AIG2-like
MRTPAASFPRHVFFYGTLLDDDLRLAVIGRRLRPDRYEAAYIEDYRRVYVTGAWYPTLVPASSERTEGLLLRRLDAADLCRLMDYEGEGFMLVERCVIGRRSGPRTAGVFLARPSLAASTVSWSFEIWRRRHKRVRDMKGSYP